MRILATLVALVAVAGIGLSVGAGGARNATTTVDVRIVEWKFTLSTETAPVGAVLFRIKNDGEEPHNFAVSDRTSALLRRGESTTLTVTFDRPGKYQYLSTWDDVDVEMVGTFTVTGEPATTAATTAPPATTAPSRPPAPGLPLRRVADVPLPGGSTRFDYQSLDPGPNRLYIAHLGDGTVVVFDVQRRRVVREIEHVDDVHGVLAVPKLGRVYAAATGSHELVTIRERDLRIVARARAGSYPDGVAYAASTGEVFVSDEHGGAEIVVGARSGRRLSAVRLGGDAGNVQYDPVSKRILVGVQSKDQLVAIDPRRRRVVARYPLPGCSSDHGLHLDPPRRLAFVACDGNAKLLLFDLKRERVTATFDVGEDPDVVDFDTSLRRLYVSAESGDVAVFQEHGRSLRKLGQAHLADGAHTVAVDPRTHLVYFPLEDVDGKPVLRIMRAA